MIKIKKVGVDAIPIIKEIADATWPVTYNEILTSKQLDYMMELIYSITSLQKQIQNGQQFIIAYYTDKPIAFAAYSPKENFSSVYKLHKIYILPNQQGKGIIHPDVEEGQNRKVSIFPFEKPEESNCKNSEGKRLCARNAHAIQKGI